MSAVWWTLLASVIDRASPEVIRLMQEKILDLRQYAKETDNPVDDVLVEVLIALVGADG